MTFPSGQVQKETDRIRESTALIDTLQRGENRCITASNCFSGFRFNVKLAQACETAKAVLRKFHCLYTPLKRGVNETCPAQTFWPVALPTILIAGCLAQTASASVQTDILNQADTLERNGHFR